MVGGRNGAGQTGWAQWATCVSPSGQLHGRGGMVAKPDAGQLGPAVVTGIINGADKEGQRITADPPLGGLAANARPNPRDLPNNHWSYAMQWFLFAATAAIIYLIAVWKRGRRPE
jgi:surfeit locus 1 family protein